MDEEEWLSCTDQLAMARVLSRITSDRKLRLFGCACLRRVWHLLFEKQSRAVVEFAERFADGLVSTEEALTVVREARRAARRLPSEATETVRAYVAAVTISLSTPPYWGSTQAAWWVAQCGSVQPDEEKEGQALILQDIAGGPFRPVSLDPAWRNSTVVSLAQAAYDNRFLPAGTLDTARLAVLADALEDAGCDNADILSHLRGPGPHVLGCWVVDLLTGRT
jgi:hypothetical protein